MAKPKISFICGTCGAGYPKWQGKCDSCGEWNTLSQDTPTDTPQGKKLSRGNSLELESLAANDKPEPRLYSGIGEMDRVCGGGLVPGSAILVGGNPGIGKSTLLLQLAARMAQTHHTTYITGEESASQIRMRAKRLGVQDSPVQLAASGSLNDIIATLSTPPHPSLVIMDSVQTLYSDAIDSAPGTVSQVRFCAHELIRLARKYGFALVLVGHVTKEGVVAGPRVLEHMVDAVMYFEGDASHQFRILRAVKNRYGATDEIGVFNMTGEGLEEVTNPSALFMSQRATPVSGTSIVAAMEGSRPLLVEIQALVAPSPLGTPRRTAIGWDVGRLNMMIAVLESRCGMSFAGKDVYLNVAGGLRLQEPATDIAAVAALVSALSDQPTPSDMVFFGEVGLAGDIRPVAQPDARINEAARLGFKRAVTLEGKHKHTPDGFSVRGFDGLRPLVAKLVQG